ncbi:MAG: phosphatase PAP2 family protein [Bacteroidales bacterium]|nr:phosphatase PAP2 family protein [Bacteroidales bacterium]
MLEKIDQQLFLFLNSLHSPAWDKVMVLVSAKLTWVPLYLFILVLLAIKYRRSFLIIIPLIILTITAADQLSVHAFKEVFMRLRPCHEPSLEGLVHTVNDKCGGMYGFVSSHAANSFAAAVLSIGLLRKKWFTVLMISWAVLVSYSRVYLGVHYPGDIIAGAVLGALLGYLFYTLYFYFDEKLVYNSNFFRNSRNNSRNSSRNNSGNSTNSTNSNSNNNTNITNSNKRNKDADN